PALLPRDFEGQCAAVQSAWRTTRTVGSDGASPSRDGLAYAYTSAGAFTVPHLPALLPRDFASQGEVQSARGAPQTVGSDRASSSRDMEQTDGSNGVSLASPWNLRAGVSRTSPQPPRSGSSRDGLACAYASVSA